MPCTAVTAHGDPPVRRIRQCPASIVTTGNQPRKKRCWCMEDSWPGVMAPWMPRCRTRPPPARDGDGGDRTGTGTWYSYFEVRTSHEGISSRHIFPSREKPRWPADAGSAATAPGMRPRGLDMPIGAVSCAVGGFSGAEDAGGSDNFIRTGPATAGDDLITKFLLPAKRRQGLRTNVAQPADNPPFGTASSAIHGSRPQTAPVSVARPRAPRQASEPRRVARGGPVSGIASVSYPTAPAT